ncbi:glycerol-3-phosphate dehydrogenase [NAD(+)], cytoplasmic isoform X4 [Agrilus planipennis]|uniref:Glycerol-3-phosphate dehydrogenase [NAD(+)] n=1 Tax=Agrilus planipennis TaxID=224129 RepID=A0A7F5R8F7_AGRPL|nr:glycerol-3-phosphate dehydrogenase [NAD(+)], cytoplasmic isoform X4 [Agrilus planipennis]
MIKITSYCLCSFIIGRRAGSAKRISNECFSPTKICCKLFISSTTVVLGANNYRFNLIRSTWAVHAVRNFCKMPSKLKKVCIIGSGNWGSAIAKIIGKNVQKLPQFDNEVTMYVYEEIMNGEKLTEIINETHENVKYLPGHILPENVVAVPDVVDAAKDADFLIFVVPHQFIRTLCSTLLGKIKPTAVGLSLIKGFDQAEGGGIELISHIISRHLKIDCHVLMGANLAGEVANENFCETTIGCRNFRLAQTLKDLIETDYFRVVVVNDEEAVEVCGALKNIVACGAGFVDGLGLGDNTKAAVIRLGLMEMIKFVEIFYPGCKLSTFFESCGVGDLVTTCYGGRNRRVSEAFVKTGKSIKQLEDELLNGQKLQGPFTAEEVNFMSKTKNMQDKFPLFTAIHNICAGKLPAAELINCIRNHPEHM